MDLDVAQRRLALDLRHQQGRNIGVHVVAGRRCGRWCWPICGSKPRASENSISAARGMLAAGSIMRSPASVGTMPSRAHQQRIARKLAQPRRERGRHRRLVHPRAGSAARDAAIGQHGVQHPDQVKVDLVEKRLVSHGRPQGSGRIRG